LDSIFKKLSSILNLEEHSNKMELEKKMKNLKEWLKKGSVIKFMDWEKAPQFTTEDVFGLKEAPEIFNILFDTISDQKQFFPLLDLLRLGLLFPSFTQGLAKTEQGIKVYQRLITMATDESTLSDPLSQQMILRCVCRLFMYDHREKLDSNSQNELQWVNLGAMAPDMLLSQKSKLTPFLINCLLPTFEEGETAKRRNTAEELKKIMQGGGALVFNLVRDWESRQHQLVAGEDLETDEAEDDWILELVPALAQAVSGLADAITAGNESHLLFSRSWLIAHISTQTHPKRRCCCWRGSSSRFTCSINSRLKTWQSLSRPSTLHRPWPT
jgi:hypothetical protein